MIKPIEMADWGRCRRAKIKRGVSGCNSIQGFVNLKKAEAISMNFDPTFNLDRMPTEAILWYGGINPRNLKEKVAIRIKEIIESEQDPFTGKPLGFVGLHTSLLKQVVEYIETGKVAPKQNGNRLTSRDVDLLAVVFERGIAGSKTPGEKDAIKALRKKVCPKAKAGA